MENLAMQYVHFKQKHLISSIKTETVEKVQYAGGENERPITGLYSVL